MIVIQGKNFYPYDLETEINTGVSEIQENGVVVSFIVDDTEKPIVFAEVKRESMRCDFTGLINKVDALLLTSLGIEAYDIVLLSPRRLPRTSSGKLQRLPIKEQYLNKDLEFLLSKRQGISIADEKLTDFATKILSGIQAEISLEAYLKHLLSIKLKVKASEFNDFEQVSLLENGVNSLVGIELVNQINKDLDLHLDATKLIELDQLGEIKNYVLNLLWLKSGVDEGEEIEI